MLDDMRMKETDADRAVRDRAYEAAADAVRAFVERFERLEAEKSDISGHQKDLMAEAKARGFSTKAIRKIAALRKMDPDKRAEDEAVLELYKSAMGLS